MGGLVIGVRYRSWDGDGGGLSLLVYYPILPSITVQSILYIRLNDKDALKRKRIKRYNADRWHDVTCSVVSCNDTPHDNTLIRKITDLILAYNKHIFDYKRPSVSAEFC
ncbi:hypothetical protein SAMN04488028_103296 [Reichenbachiella agariperforans]|uniref:Uncharacterized protein n=1 Tax=Reichenbachiella agariperforans TaxID=156994 RepID=A0A1M6QEQ8_REIAG|nr:hypothetical protein SAMN04488028_103296 [Reichenbachiella agariperforans]